MNQQPQPEPAPILLTIEAAAKYMSVSRSTIYRLINSGDLRIVRPAPNAPRILRRDLNDLAAKLTQP